MKLEIHLANSADIEIVQNLVRRLGGNWCDVNAPKYKLDGRGVYHYFSHLIKPEIKEIFIHNVDIAMKEKSIIPVIKAIRIYTYICLREAKDFVESIRVD